MPSNRCPIAFVRGSSYGDAAFEAVALWERWRWWKVLPYDGGMGRQPAWVAQAIEVVDVEWHRVQTVNREQKTRQKPDTHTRFAPDDRTWHAM